MPEPTGGEKTLPASPRKIQQQREKGNVAKSQDLSAGVTLVAAFLALYFLGPAAFRELLSATRHYFSEAHLPLAGAADVQGLAMQAILAAAPMVLPIMVALLVAGVAANIAQIGFMVSPQAMLPKFERLNPISGFQRFVSMRALVELIKSLAKLSVISYIAYISVRTRTSEILSLTHMSPAAAATIAWDLVLTVWWRVALAIFVIGLFDFAFQRWQYGRDLMMTHHEARQELKEMEGDPQIRQRVRQIQRRIAMQRMLGDVPDAEVVITNPITYAVALRYSVDDMESPIVVAKGARIMAERIRSIAEENGVPIVEKPELARDLFRTVEVGQPIAPDLFRAVAEVLAYVYEIDERLSKREERKRRQLTAPAFG